MYDVCIIGAGVSGGSLALNVSEKLKVCLVERKKPFEIGYKVCGDAVQGHWVDKWVKPNLKRMNVILQLVKELRIEIPGETLRGKVKGYMIDRYRFGRRLFELALDKGCEYIMGSAKPVFKGGKVDHIKVNKGKVKAKIYVDASGVSAVLRRHFLLNKPEMFTICYREIIKKPVGIEWNYWYSYIPRKNLGYWVFPEGEKLNVGVGTHLKSGLHAKGRLKLFLSEFKKSKGLNGKVLESGWGLVPRYKPIKLARGNIAAIGDAGFTVNPIHASGMGPSIYTANLLSKHLLSEFKAESFNRDYWERIGRKYLYFYLILKSAEKTALWRKFFKEMF